jgi:tetratricopeptide (TPR) repeat protein
LPFLQLFAVTPLWTMISFERWDDVLAAPAPAASMPFVRAAWRYARTRALTAKGLVAAAQAELGRLRALVDGANFNAQSGFTANSGQAILRIGVEIASGEIAAARGDYARAIAHLDRAVRFEDALVYQEPSDWPHSARVILGRVLLAAGRADEAEVVYWDDLRRNPETGWALFGLKRALEAQGKKDDAMLIEARLNKAWSRADFVLAR